MRKANSLLTADTHFTDNPLDEYRWNIFNVIRDIAKVERVDFIYILGDLTDRKDRHSATLLNRLVEELTRLKEDTGAQIYILSGNHDAPLTGPYYWNFLNSVEIEYVQFPKIRNGVFLLPFTTDPMTDWKDFQLYKSLALLIHQTVEGALIEGDRRIPQTPNPMPLMPRGIPIFSGDVHRPQQIGGITYVGTPHPVRFGEDWPGRVLLIKQDNFNEPQEIHIPSIRRAILDIHNSKELLKVQFKSGDQVRVRYILNGQTITSLPVEMDIIRQWAKDKGVILASVEAKLEGDGFRPQHSNGSAVELMPPETVVRTFGAQENLSSEVIDIGIELVKECR